MDLINWKNIKKKQKTYNFDESLKVQEFSSIEISKVPQESQENTVDGSEYIGCSDEPNVQLFQMEKPKFIHYLWG